MVVSRCSEAQPVPIPQLNPDDVELASLQKRLEIAKLKAELVQFEDAVIPVGPTDQGNALTIGQALQQDLTKRE